MHLGWINLVMTSFARSPFDRSATRSFPSLNRFGTMRSFHFGTLAQCGLEIVDLGNTYLADRLTESGNIIESALDHTYISSELKTKTRVYKLDSSSTDIK